MCKYCWFLDQQSIDTYSRLDIVVFAHVRSCHQQRLRTLRSTTRPVRRRGPNFGSKINAEHFDAAKVQYIFHSCCSGNSYTLLQFGWSNAIVAGLLTWTKSPCPIQLKSCDNYQFDVGNIHLGAWIVLRFLSCMINFFVPKGRRQAPRVAQWRA